MTAYVVRTGGIPALYNGLSASILRQLTYSTVRFGVYDSLSTRYKNEHNGSPLPFYKKLALGAAGGAAGGIVGCPADLVNVRMQADIRSPPEQRRNYKHGLDGLWKVARKEGVAALWNGGTMVFIRAILMTTCQVAVYDQTKQMLLQTKYFEDTVVTHFTSSFIAGFVATVMTQPADVLKTRLMNARRGEFKTFLHCIYYTGKAGPTAFFKGFVPAFVRLGPHTILTFIFLEQFRRILS
jgi:dicarboxylate transporter 10